VPWDCAEAMKWFRLAADQGYAQAQANLGAMYENGQVVPPDYVTAYMWFSFAAAGAQEGYLRVSFIRVRDDVAKLMTSDQIAEAQRVAREWKPTGRPAATNITAHSSGSATSARHRQRRDDQSGSGYAGWTRNYDHFHRR
jgi:TPR repeat protein